MRWLTICGICILLPTHFCWTRFGTEAGEGIAQILFRKERERVANAGVFLWGIGNAIGPSIRRLVELEKQPEVVFSPMRSAPRKQDADPDEIVVWMTARTLDGQHFDLPGGSVVTSRAKQDGRRNRHYALVCASNSSLRIDLDDHRIPFSALRNLLTNRPVGASQVTAIVRQMDDDLPSSGAVYRVAMRALLVSPHFIELLNPVPVPRVGQAVVEDGLGLRHTVLKGMDGGGMLFGGYRRAF